MTPKERLARIAYQAYGQTTNFKNYQGLPMPAFDDLTPTIKEAWGSAVKASSQFLLTEMSHFFDCEDVPEIDSLNLPKDLKGLEYDS